MIRFFPHHKHLRRSGILLLILAALLAYFLHGIIGMPGRSWSGPLPALTPEELAVRDGLRAHVQKLAGEIGERHSGRADALLEAGYYIAETLRRAGHQPIPPASTPGLIFKQHGITQVNIASELPGAAHPDRILVVGAHYDTVPGSPGADDNASGAAALLEIARLLAGRKLPCTVRLLFFFNEEGRSIGPNGAELYARHCRGRNENIIGMISLEMLGFYGDAPNSQRYPVPAFKLLYPTNANFIGFVGNYRSRRFVHETVGAFRGSARFPSIGAALPDWFKDAARSDQYSFWIHGYPGLMVTDTANFRNRNYHRRSDTPATLDYDRAARVAAGLARAIERLAR